jgi:glucose/mannose-6-phosphate isomerase
MMPDSLLDDRDFVLRNDPSGMYRLTCEFPEQCARALEIASGTTLHPLSPTPNLAMLTGLGGSAAGGDLVRAIFEETASVPFLVNRDYALPHFVDSASLVFACSYSGNTEETLSAFNFAQAKGARMAIVTSGGVLAELASNEGLTLIQIPGGQPPRTALGYLFVPVLHACERWGLVPEQDFGSALSLLKECVADWGIETPLAENAPKKLATALHGKVPLLYGLGSWQGIVAYRWKGQIGENAKVLSFAHVFPELNHNEILGWVKADCQGVDRWAVVILEDGRESAKMKARARVTSELIGDKADVFRVQARGETLLERMLSLTLFGDFVSLYMAVLNDVDPENIDSINVLKSALSRVF